MKTQATRCSQKKLAYLSYWMARGYRFKIDEEIPEDTSIPPRSDDMPRPIELAVTAGLLIAIAIWQAL